ELEHTNLPAPEFCARSGVTDCVPFCGIAGPVRLDIGTRPAASEWPNFDNRCTRLHWTRRFRHHAGQWNTGKSSGATRASLVFACLGKVNLSGYLHTNRCFIIACRGFLKGLDHTSTLKSSQRLDHGHVEVLAIRFGVPKPSANADL